MNHDPVKFCVHCQQPRERAGFRPLPGLRARREVCEICYQKVMEARKRIAATPPIKVPFG